MNLFGKAVVALALSFGMTYAYADDVLPTVTIGGNDGPVALGEMVILSADYEEAKLPPGTQIYLNWVVVDDGKEKRVLRADGGREIGFAVGMQPKAIAVVLDVTYLVQTHKTVKVTGDDGKVTEQDVVVDAHVVSSRPIFSQVVVAGNPLPPDPSPPTPTPTPAPVLPSGQFGLAQFSYDTLVNSGLSPADRVKLATALGNGLSGIASKIAALPSYTDLSKILADTKAANDTAFLAAGIDISAADPIKQAFRTKIKALYEGQKINTATDIATAWRELASGLGAVK